MYKLLEVYALCEIGKVQCGRFNVEGSMWKVQCGRFNVEGLMPLTFLMHFVTYKCGAFLGG
jgi:hypothetical protein